jgi:hypothetical protein
MIQSVSVHERRPQPSSRDGRYVRFLTLGAESLGASGWGLFDQFGQKIAKKWSGKMPEV